MTIRQFSFLAKDKHLLTFKEVRLIDEIKRGKFNFRDDKSGIKSELIWLECGLIIWRLYFVN